MLAEFLLPFFEVKHNFFSKKSIVYFYLFEINKNMEDIIGCVHIATMNHWKNVVAELFKEIKDSGLMENTKIIYLGILGKEKFFPTNDMDCKFKILCSKKSFSPAECLTLNKLREKTQQLQENHKIWYIHTKGVSKPKCKRRQNCRRYMSYFIIKKWRDCYKCLDSYDACGVNWIKARGPVIHDYFSGNFWWTNSSFIARLPAIKENNRFNAENFLGNGSPKIYCFCNNRNFQIPKTLTGKWFL